jgi:hypothetical protein
MRRSPVLLASILPACVALAGCGAASRGAAPAAICEDGDVAGCEARCAQKDARSCNVQRGCGNLQRLGER